MTARRSYDYIVVGGGSAGCIVAAELSENHEVLLLEAGPHAEAHPETLIASKYKDAFINPELMHERFSVTDSRWGTRRLFMGSGRGLGGSGSVNAMVYTRGAKEDFDQWPEGWRWDDVAPDFDAVESVLHPHKRPPTDWTERCITAAERSGFRRSENLNNGDLQGVLGYEWMNYEGDQRRSSFAAFLQPVLHRESLTVQTGAIADRVIFDGDQAIGVSFRVDGKPHAARAKKEVILCAGSLATPAILLRSGVGEADALRKLGIEVVLDQPEVGRNLHDHPNVQLFFRGKRDVDCNYPQLYGFHRVGNDPSLAPGQPDTCYVFYPARSSFREGLMRLLPGIVLPEHLYDKGKGALETGVRTAFRNGALQQFVRKMWGIVVILGKPRSRGRLWIETTDPTVTPRIDPGYFADPRDLETLLRGVQLAREVSKNDPLRGFGNGELLPGRLNRNLERWARKNVMTTYHYAGTCAMGTVTDSKLRVQGLEGLRIADASVMPVTPVAALNAPSMLIGWRAAQYCS